MTEHNTSYFIARRIPLVAAILAIIIGLVVMVAWVVDFRLLQTIFPNLASMKFNTALSFLLCGTALRLLNNSRKNMTIVRNGAVIVVLLIGLLSLLATLLKQRLFLDELFVADLYTQIEDFPGRMSQGTAVSFVILSLSIIFLLQRKQYIAEFMAVLVNLLAWLAVFGYVFDVNALYEVYIFQSMALHTALTFILLSLGVIFIIPDGLIRSLVIDPTPVGDAIRFLLPAALLIPSIIGWFSVLRVKNGLDSPTFVLAEMTLLTVTFISILVIMFTLSMRYWYRRYQASQDRLLQNEIYRIQLEKERELSQQRNRFLAMLSHDMRNPISTIVLSTDLLLGYDERMDNVQHRKHLKKIRHQARNILVLLEDLISIRYFEPEAQSLPFHPIEEDIVQFCRDYLKAFSEFEQTSKHHFILNVPQQAIQLSFDVKLMKRMLDNLLGNALKYSPQGGAIELLIEQRGSAVNLSIRDSGIGIPPESMDALFRLYSRADNVNDLPGYGLGLAIVHHIVTLHKGTIKVDSTMGKGTTFTVNLPLQKEVPLREQARLKAARTTHADKPLD